MRDRQGEKNAERGSDRDSKTDEERKKGESGKDRDGKAVEEKQTDRETDIQADRQRECVYV